MAIVLNVFDRLISSISEFKKNVSENIKFLSSIILGALIAILLFSKGITYLLANHYMIVNFFFIGVIVGSIPMIYQKATKDSFKPLHLIPCIITLVAMLVTVYCVPNNEQVILRSLDLMVTIKLFLTSMIAAICMVIPGISGSFVMLLFGVYETITTAISEMNIIVLIPIGIGVIIGIFLATKIINALLQKYPQATYFAILGLMIGSIFAIIDKIYVGNTFLGGIHLIIAIIVLIIGLLISMLFSSEKFKSMINRKTIN